MPTFGSLFSGIGGIDLGLERAGWECRWQVENDAFCQLVLERHWPDIIRYGDIRGIRWDDVEPVDLLVGGFPCQPVSQAGARRGQKDERWLWPEFARAIRGLRPRWVLVENVPGLLTLNGGAAADEVFGGLAELGYDFEWASIPAAAVGAPHLRYRVFVVAHADRQRFSQRDGEPLSGLEAPQRDDPVGLRPAMADTGGPPRGSPRPAGQAVFGSSPLERPRRCSCCGGEHWAVEPGMGRVAHGVPARLDRLKSLGNAVVPQVAEWIGRRLMEAHRAR